MGAVMWARCAVVHAIRSKTARSPHRGRFAAHMHRSGRAGKNMLGQPHLFPPLKICCLLPEIPRST
jgi:hypothetical protein